MYIIIADFGKIINMSVGPVKIYAQNYLQAPAECSQPAIKASSRAASRCFMFMYFGCPPHGEAERRPASEQSCRQGMFPPRGFCGGSHGSAAQSHCWCGCASNAHWENRSRSASPQLGSLLQLHGAQFGNDRFSLVAGRLCALLGVDRLESFATILTLDLGTTEKTLR